MKIILMLFVCLIFSCSTAQSGVERLLVFVVCAAVGSFVLFSFRRKKQEKEEPPNDIREVIELLRLIEDTAYQSITHDDIRFRKGSYTRSVEGLGIVSVEIHRNTIIRQILCSGEDIKSARWVSGWLARHRDENWVVHEIDDVTYEMLVEEEY